MEMDVDIRNEAETGSSGNESTVLKVFVLTLLSLSLLGMVVYEVSVHIHENDLFDMNAGEFIGRIMIITSLMATSIFLVAYGLSPKNRDTVRFGCLLLSGVLIAFTMVAFL